MRPLVQEGGIGGWVGSDTTPDPLRPWQTEGSRPNQEKHMLRRVLFYLFTQVLLQPDLPDEFLLGFDPVNMRIHVLYHVL